MKHAFALFIAFVLPASAAPVWDSREIEGDSLFFVQAENEPAAKASLLFVPASAPVLRSATREVAFEMGRDFTWTAGSRTIVLTKDSRIPFKTTAGLHPAPGSPNSYDGFRDGKSHMLYAQGRFFHDLQTVANYSTTESWTGPKPAPAKELERIRARLAAREPVKLVVLGDSISTGLNASLTGDAPPRQPGYPELVAQALAKRFGSKVEMKNLSVIGMGANWGLKQMPAVLAEAPDLLICAFGMNDASGKIAPDQFAATLREIVARLHTARPGCDAILVSPMCANPEWNRSSPELYPAYAEEMKKLSGPGCAIADVTTVWTTLLERKGVLDLSGNGLNHPNDFGHRIYADVILDTLGPAR
jgi:acyl-CoA thioesterase I